MDLLNSGGQQAAQGQQQTAQSLQQQQDLANILKKEGQNSGNKQFTSPWQTAGQWAQALAGRQKQGQINQGSQGMNAALQPGQGPVQGATPQPAPGGGSAPMVPGQSPAGPPDGGGGNLPWSGAPASSALAPDAGAGVADAGMAGGGMMDAGMAGAGAGDLGIAALFA